MSPRVFKEGKFVFWFHSYDVLHESRASIHVGKGPQNDAGDAKIWLEPQIEIGRPGRTLVPWYGVREVSFQAVNSSVWQVISPLSSQG